MKISEVDIKDINMKPFKVKPKLHPDFFDEDGLLKSQIRLRLLDIADDFIETLEIKWVKPEDIVLTGSIANYNWSEYSDIDVHVIYDFKKIYDKSDFVQEYFMSKKDLWNDSHDKLTIKGFPVEMSVENLHSPLHSSGVYSLEKSEWVKEPSEMDDSKLDTDLIKRYCAKQMTSMDELFDKLDKENDRKKLEILANKLETVLKDAHDKRTEGLKTKAQELSNGNIIWKVIKHMGYVEKTYDYLNKVYDRRNTIDEIGNHPSPKHIIITEAQMNDVKKLYAPLSKFIPTINKALHLSGVSKLDPNNPMDKRIAYAAFAKAGFKDISKRKNTEDGWIKMMTVSDYTRKNITDYIRDAKLKSNSATFDTTCGDELYGMPAADMQNFIDTDDVSSINERLN